MRYLIPFSILLSTTLACAPKQAADSSSSATSTTDAEMTAALPIDPSIRRGTLGNGMQYFIEPNAYPQDRVELRLVVKVGSRQEDPDQLGLAHFLEHMAFNGTANFEAGELVDFLQSKGVSFGAHLNAMTSFDATIYQLSLPTDEEGLVDKGLLILEDWAHGLNLDPEEIEKERGVVLEEWRRAQGAGFRMAQQVFPLYLGPDYGERFPIGTEESLQNFEHASLARFYADWYRPDLMAVVVVGDVDGDAMEAKIQAQFGVIEGSESARQLKVSTPPTYPEGEIHIFTDPEVGQVGLEVTRAKPFQWGNSLQDLKPYFASRFAFGMLNERIGFLARQENSPILGAFAGDEVFSSTVAFETINIGVTPDHIESGLEAVLTELRRAQLHGFTEAEWNRAIAGSKSSWQSIVAEMEKTESGMHAEEIIRHFLTGEYMVGTSREYELAQQMMDELLTVEDANAAIQDFLSPENRLVILTGPEMEGLTLPTKGELQSVLERVQASSPAAPEEEAEAAPLIAERPEPGTIVSESVIEDLGVTIWELSNGITVHLKPTDLQEDEVLMSSTSWGGYSTMEDADLVPARTAVSLAHGSGLGEHDMDSLVRILAGNTAGVSPVITGLREGFEGQAAPRDLETLFQLMYLRVVSPRFDQDAFDRAKQGLGSSLENRLSDPSVRYNDMRIRILLQDHPRQRPWTTDTLEQMDLAQSEAIYRERFADMSDHHFFFVGAIDLEVMRPLVETWLATLPAVEREDSWKDRNLRYVEGVHTETMYAGDEPKALVSIDFSGDFEFDRTRVYQMGAAAEALEIVLRNQLREELGGTYSVSVSVESSRIPVEDYNFRIVFGCAPDRVEELKKQVYTELERLQKSPMDSEIVAGIIESDLRSLETRRQRNGHWVNVLESYHERGEDPRNHLKVEERYQSLTGEQIMKIYQDYFNMDRRVETFMMPESYAP